MGTGPARHAGEGVLHERGEQRVSFIFQGVGWQLIDSGWQLLEQDRSRHILQQGKGDLHGQRVTFQQFHEVQVFGPQVAGLNIQCVQYSRSEVRAVVPRETF